MDEMTRRAALQLTALAGASVAGARTALAQQALQVQEDVSQEEVLDSTAALNAAAAPDGPVLFWHDVALAMNVFDHSLTGEAASLARAAGPTASARALAVVHAVLADAARLVLEPGNSSPPYDHFLIDGARRNDVLPAAFIGGATDFALRHVYDTSLHEGALVPMEARFLGDLRAAWPNVSGMNQPAWIGYVQSSWIEGMRFADGEGADNAPLRILWNGDQMRFATTSQSEEYTGGLPGEFAHRPDPLNPDQKFYGVRYAERMPPWVLTSNEVTTPDEAQWFVKRPPAHDSPEFRASLERVKELGRLRELRSGTDPLLQPIRLTDEQINKGLFWAYDGARNIGTPPRLYNQILRQVAVADGFNEARLARLFALANIAMSDAGHVAWEAKYRHNYPRPVVWIREGAPEELRDPQWRPLGSPRTNRREASPESIISQSPPLQTLVQSRDSSARFVGQASGDLLDPLRNLSLTLNGLPVSAPRERAQIASQDVQSLTLAGTLTVTLTEESEDVPAEVRLFGAHLFTPNFPAFPSGHATFGAAAFEMLKLVRGEGDPEAGNSLQSSDPSAPGMVFVSDELNGLAVHNLGSDPEQFPGPRRPFRPQRFETIDAMIEANNESREHLGVHWDFDSILGAEAGKKVAARVWDKQGQVSD